NAGGGVAVANCIIPWRCPACRGVTDTGRIGRERLRPSGRVGLPGRVAKERIETSGRVVEAGCHAVEGPSSFGCVVVGQASVRCCGSVQRSKGAERERKQKDRKTTPERHPPR